MKYKETTFSNKTEHVPRHIAFIMDGNGRWATKRLLPRKAGHKRGVDVMKKIVDYAFERGIECVSIYAFSTENQNRPNEEKEALFNLIEEYFASSIEELIEKEVKITFMGDLSFFSEKLVQLFDSAVKRSCGFSGKVFNIGLNYGSRNEIVSAVNKLVELGKSVDEKTFSEYLFTSDLPDPDLIIRTGGEQRLSNFLMYQAAYSELMFVKTLWPDFTKKEFDRILVDFSSRDRRFGRV